MALNDNSQFNADGLGSNDHQAGWLRAMAMAAAGILPSSQSQVNATSGNVANAIATATLPAPAAGLFNYLTGFEVSGSGATAGLPVVVTVTGVVGGPLSYIYTAAAGALLGNLPLTIEFTPPLKAAAAASAIVVSCPALGAGNTNNTVNAHGFKA